MNPHTIATPARPLAFAILFLALLAGAAQAQLRVEMKFTTKNFVDHEAIMANVRVSNLAGHDLILSGEGGGGWLDFDIRRGNHGLSKRPDAPSLKPRALQAGSSYTETVNLGRYYPLALPSNYAITANVYYAPLKKYFSSQRVLINVLKAKTLWSQSFGVPQGNNRPVQFRKHALLSFRDRNTSNLYVRVSSEDNTAVYSTRSIGKVLRSFEPAVYVDSANQLHVLHLGGPQFYAHTIVDTDGSIVRQDYYKEVNGSRPEMKNQTGRIVVLGGVKTDRHGMQESEYTTTRPQQDSNRPRSATDRPEGLPVR